MVSHFSIRGDARLWECGNLAPFARFPRGGGKRGKAACAFPLFPRHRHFHSPSRPGSCHGRGSLPAPSRIKNFHNSCRSRSLHRPSLRRFALAARSKVTRRLSSSAPTRCRSSSLEIDGCAAPEELSDLFRGQRFCLLHTQLHPAAECPAPSYPQHLLVLESSPFSGSSCIGQFSPAAVR